nr:RecName: Full=Cytochrome c oxidase subunit 7B-heart, mitochondrial; AltName: Full=Cytochrome c oxidase polypeptide VIIb-heart [Thunnus obesus]
SNTSHQDFHLFYGDNGMPVH